MKEIKNFPIPDDADSEGIENLPRSARRKIAAELKAKTESPKDGSKKLLMDRRQFLKATAITGTVALAASSGLIYAAGRKESEAVSATSEAVASASDLEGLQAALGVDYAAEIGEDVPALDMADALIILLEAYNTDYIFWLTDDEITPVADKLTTRHMAGEKPWPIKAMHEFGSVAMADGYAAATERVGVGFFGANQGPMNAHGAFYNTYGHCRPVVIIGSHNPAEREPYQGQFWSDPGELVRECTKWTAHFNLTENLEKTFKHAMAVADQPPKGPVMITTSHDIWRKPMPNGTVHIPDASRLTAALPSVPNGDALEEAANLLVNAENPLIVAGKMMGRCEEAVTQLVGLAELLGAPVVESGAVYTTFPFDHPLHLGFSSSAVKDADVVLVIDATQSEFPRTTKVITLHEDPVQAQALGFRGTRLAEADIRMDGAASASIPALMEAIMAHKVNSWGKFKQATKERADAWKVVHDQQRADWQAIIDSHMGEKPISAWQAAYEVDKIAGDDTILFEDIGYGRSRCWQYCWHTNVPKAKIHGRSSHLAQAPYAAIGACVGRPDKQIIHVGGDLNWHMGHLATALWTAAHHNLPILYIMDDNHWLVTTKNGQMGNKAEGLEYDYWWAHEVFPPWTDYSKHAEGTGVYGECVKEPGELGPALRRGLDWVQANSLPALIDIWTAPLV